MFEGAWWNILITVLGVVLGYVFSWLLMKYSTGWQQKAITFADDVVVKTVVAVNQTWVAQRKLAETTGDYVFGEAEQALAKKVCLDQVWTEITGKMKKYLLLWFSGNVAAMEQHIDTGVENAVKLEKEKLQLLPTAVQVLSEPAPSKD